MKINLDSQNLTLRSNPNVSHDDGAEMYSCYGAHISTDDHGDIRVQAVDYEWMDDDIDGDTWSAEAAGGGDADEINQARRRSDDYAVLSLHAEGKLDWDTCEQLVDLARRIRGDMDQIDEVLERAAEAALAGNFEATIEALIEASGLETDHGDDPSTSALAAQLLAEKEVLSEE